MERLSWVGLGWGEAGGAAAREVALWVALQREFHRRGVLPSAAVRRLSLLGLQWEPQARALPRAVCHAPARPLAGELLAALAAPQRGSQPCLSCRSAADAARRATWHAEPRSLLAVLPVPPHRAAATRAALLQAALLAAPSTLSALSPIPYTLVPCCRTGRPGSGRGWRSWAAWRTWWSATSASMRPPPARRRRCRGPDALPQPAGSAASAGPASAHSLHTWHPSRPASRPFTCRAPSASSAWVPGCSSLGTVRCHRRADPGKGFKTCARGGASGGRACGGSWRSRRRCQPGSRTPAGRRPRSL